jgi:hypothetical protein
MRKSVIFFALIWSVLLIGFVSAQSSCGEVDDHQLIMRISGDTNAHGEEWDSGIYDTEICYNDHFSDFDAVGGFVN